MYKLHLILKYLLKRRIAWVSLIAVMLCTTMVLVVISVMGGWLNMFKISFRGLSGDIVVASSGLAGFDRYQQIIEQIRKDPDVAAAVPTIETYGLLTFRGNSPTPVKVMGIPITQIGQVNHFPSSLFRQHTFLEEKLKEPDLPADLRKVYAHRLQQPPSFDLLNEVSYPLDSPPSGVRLYEEEANEAMKRGTLLLPPTFPKDLQKTLRGRLRYDADRKRLVFTGQMQADWKDPLASLSPDSSYKDAINHLFQESEKTDLIDYHLIAPDVSNPSGMIVGAGVIGIHRNRQGQWEGRGPAVYETPAKLTVLGFQQGGSIDMGSKSEHYYFVVDDSRTQVWQYDNNYIYVPLDLLQKDLGMQAQSGPEVVKDEQGNFHETGRMMNSPARVTEIRVKVRDGIDPNDEQKLHEIAKRIENIVGQTLFGDLRKQGFLVGGSMPKVSTWQDQQRIWINAVENEKLLTVVLFGIISVVAIFLIFCIFYMIVVEKTRDIGIIKSVGATSAGVLGIFLGYGLVIGVLGAALGLALSYGIVHNINELHALLGKLLGVQIWNPEVYLFDRIPNKMSGSDLATILPIAVIASVLGALVPAIRAARMNPVEALRWE